MARIEFGDLLDLYRNAKFGKGGADDESEVTVTTQAIVKLLTRVENEEYAGAETGITLLDDLAKVKIGAKVKVRLDDPRSGFAVLAHGVEWLINSPSGRVEEPKRFYLVDPAYAPGDAVVPEVVARYRKVLAVVQLLAKAASLLDATRSELIFVKEGKVVLSIRFDAEDLAELDVAAADRQVRIPSSGHRDGHLRWPSPPRFNPAQDEARGFVISELGRSTPSTRVRLRPNHHRPWCRYLGHLRKNPRSRLNSRRNARLLTPTLK